MSKIAPELSAEVIGLTTKPTSQTAYSRTDRAADLLDAAMAKVAKQIETGPISSSLLREIVQLAKAAGVEIAQQGQAMSGAVDSVLASLDDVDPAIFGLDDYTN